MKFCSVGGKNIERERIYAITKSFALDEDFASNILTPKDVLNAALRARSFSHTYNETTKIFSMTPASGQRNSRYYFATSGALTETQTQNYSASGAWSAVYPTTLSGVSDMTAVLRYFSSYANPTDLSGTFLSDNRPMQRNSPQGRNGIGAEDTWHGYTPRLVIYPPSITGDGNLYVEKTSSGAVTLSSFYNASGNEIDYYYGYGSFSQSRFNPSNNTFTFYQLNQTITFSGETIIGAHTANQLAVLQGFQNGNNYYSRTDRNGKKTYYDIYATYRYLNSYYMRTVRQGEGAGVVRPIYTKRGAANDPAKTFKSLVSCVMFLDTLAICKLEKDVDFISPQVLPGEIYDLMPVEGARHALFSDKYVMELA